MSKSTPSIIPRDQHPVSRNQMSPSALKVMHRLHTAGYEAYLVGGGVRDILLGQPMPTLKKFMVCSKTHG